MSSTADPHNIIIKDEIIMEAERVLNTYDSASDFTPTNVKVLKDVKEYVKGIRVEIVNEDTDEGSLEFDLIGLEAPIANALRRVLIAEVPSMAVEKVMLYQNTSVIQDEVLCHRLGLLPLKVDARKFEWPGVTIDGINENGVDMDEEPPVDPKKHLVFELNVSCKSLKKIVENDTVFTSAIKWLPLGSQEVEFGDDVPRMVQDDIIVAKMKPGQQIECKLHCVKGIGRDHAKFSPVATASYRLLPTIGLKENFYDGVGEKLQSCFSQGVIEMVDGEDMKKVAVVKDARADLCSRNVLRHEEFQGKVELGRVKNHFIFSVETIGALPPRVLVVEACKILQWKAQGLKNIIEQKLK